MGPRRGGFSATTHPAWGRLGLAVPSCPDCACDHDLAPYMTRQTLLMQAVTVASDAGPAGKGERERGAGKNGHRGVWAECRQEGAMRSLKKVCGVSFSNVLSMRERTQGTAVQGDRYAV